MAHCACFHAAYLFRSILETPKQSPVETVRRRSRFHRLPSCRCVIGPRGRAGLFGMGADRKGDNRAGTEGGWQNRPRALAPPQVPTLAELNRWEPHWLWWNCSGCSRWVAVPLAPFVIRWGADASSDLLRKNPRCTKCGHRGGLLQVPSHHSLEMPYQPFPAEHAIRSLAPESA